ncbi:TonB-dependent receptor plug domain-containing protein [Aurantiacibacter marinus]|uniref:TonB-dependent receptor n=1 Tax=Aurantiacibacter marinus TaxID=874156 RepID=A0A0H0XSM6_9SPHN|nr:TonB-dependent receptor [Aurantiacibacter marinus]KLI65006.1 TonB-dependent receptor [Aurantiacibacter marinus]
MKTPLFASIALSFAATPVFAQVADEPDEQPSDFTIIVLGEGLPDTPAAPAYSTVEIDRISITSSGSGRLDDVLRNVAGFQQFRRSDSRSSNPTAQGVTLRALGGNATTRALVTLDGVPLTDPFFGHVPFNAVSPDRLGSISVTRGGGSGPFGAGALAGTIALNSADARTLGLLNASALVNDRGETELSASIAPEIGDGYAIVSGRWDRGQGFFTTPLDQRVSATARAQFESWSVSGRLVQPVGDGLELQLRGLAYDDARTLRLDGQDSTTEGQDISARLVSRGPWQVDVLGYALWRNFTNVVISSSSFNPVLDQRDTPSTGLGGKIELRPPVGDAHTLRIGVDFRQSEGNLEEVNTFSGLRLAGGVNSMFGLFAEDDLELGDIVLTGGVRLDRSSIRDGYFETVAAGRTLYPDRSDWYFSWRAGALLEASDTIRLRATAYTGLRQPTLNELYRPFQIFPVTFLANAELELERLEGYEVGVDWLPAPGAKLSLTAFDNEVENAVANVTIGTNLSQRRNLDAIEARGIEASAQYAAGSLSFKGSLAITDAEVRGTGFAAPLDGLQPAQTPDWAASFTASWQPVSGALFSATLRHTGKQFEDDRQSDILPAATTVDLFAQYPLIEKLSAVGRVENLLDERIVTLNRGGTLDLGVPQTFWIGLRYGF